MNTSLNRKGSLILGLLLLLIASAWLIWRIGWLVNIDHGYSPDVTLRLQTNALLQGRLALQPLPFYGGQDWAWGKEGLHQVWGMGVPLLRLPFELAAAVFAKAPFPDRWLFILMYLAAGWFLWRGLQSARTIEAASCSSALSRVQDACVFIGIMCLGGRNQERTTGNRSGNQVTGAGIGSSSRARERV